MADFVRKKMHISRALAVEERLKIHQFAQSPKQGRCLKWAH